MNRDFNEKILGHIAKENYLLEDDLSKIKTKTIVIWGDKDRVIHVSCTDVIKKGLPGSTIVVIKNCGHLPMIERPDETARYYLEFLGKV